MSRPTVRTLKGGTFNVLYGRDRQVVKGEVERLLKKHDLDFLCLQEAVDYYNVFRDIEGYDYIAEPSMWSAMESTILVKSSLKKDRIRFHQYGDGWVTVRGGKHPPTGQAEVRIEGWLFVRSLHLPTPSVWRNGKLEMPEERRDDYIAAMEGLRKYFRYPCKFNGRIAAGDWNEPPTTVGEYSPDWLMNKTKARGIATDSRAGHGRIDWPMFKGVNVSRIFKDLEFNEKSDHEPVIFKVTKVG